MYRYRHTTAIVNSDYTTDYLSLRSYLDFTNQKYYIATLTLCAKYHTIHSSISSLSENVESTTNVYLTILAFRKCCHTGSALYYTLVLALAAKGKLFKSENRTNNIS